MALLREINGKTGWTFVSIEFDVEKSFDWPVRVVRWNGQLRSDRSRLPEKNETTFGGRLVPLIDNEVQECHACSHKTALVGTKSRVESVWDFSDFCIEF
jgi:hypothetical protein